MKTLAAYILASVAVSGVFYLVYALLLRRDALFRFNRVYLLLSVLLTVILPLVVMLPLSMIPAVYNTPVNEFVHSAILDPVIINSSSAKGISLEIAVAFVYLIVVLVLSIRFFIRLASLSSVAAQADKYMMGRIKVYWVNSEIVPFSFWRTVYLPGNLRNSEYSAGVIRHETAHVRAGHTADILLLQLVRIIFWFNPFLVLLDKALRETHEYQADQDVLSGGIAPEKYTQLLLGCGTDNLAAALGNNLNNSTLKRRITMFYQGTTPTARLKATLAMPLAILLAIIFAFGCKQPTVNNETPVAPQVTEAPPVHQVPGGIPEPPPPPPPPSGDIFSVVDQLPEFQGGTSGMAQYMSKSIKYPEEAKSKGLQGTVYVQFVVETDGRVNMAKVSRGFDKTCDAEALRVVKAMPAWNPGMQNGVPVRVQLSLPVKFKLN